MEKVPVVLLNSFVIFNNSKNIVAAAAHLGITQPALSKQLKLLEIFFPEPVFAMQGRRKLLTPFGRKLHHSLAERFGNVQEVIRQVQTLHLSPRHATLRIAGRRGILDRISHKIGFDGALHFFELSNEATIEALAKLGAELGITHIVPDTHELIAKPLFREAFQLVVPKSVFPSRPTLGAHLLSRLREIPCIGYRPNDEILNAFFTSYASVGSGIRMVRATENYSSIAAMVEAKIGWAILPSYFSVLDRENWAIPIPTKALPTRQFFVIYRAEFASLDWFKKLILEIHSCFKAS